MRIGLFGGTFDPVHLGHIEISFLVKDFFKLDKIIIIPNASPPHKKTYTNPMHRFRMLLLAFENFSGFEISTYEMDKKNEKFTVDTINYFKDKYIKDNLFYIIGGDSLIEMEKWNQGYNLIKMINFIVVERPDFNLTKFHNNIIEKILLMFNNNPISSTKIRNMLKNKINCSFLLNDKVKKYIELNNLYI